MGTQVGTDDRVIISAQVSTERREQLARMAQEADRSLSTEITLSPLERLHEIHAGLSATSLRHVHEARSFREPSDFVGVA